MNPRYEFSFRDKTDTIVVAGGNWIPSVSLGIGKLIGIGRSFSSFEIRYSLGINRNRKGTSLTGDNTGFVHCFTAMQYQVFY
jgi:hypothetical protein